MLPASYRLDNGDFVITKKQLENSLDGNKPEAIVIRTLGNGLNKLTPEIAAAFSDNKTEIHLGGITNLSLDVAKILSKTKGFIFFGIRINLTHEAKQFLKSNGKIIFPQNWMVASDYDAAQCQPTFFRFLPG